MVALACIRQRLHRDDWCRSRLQRHDGLSGADREIRPSNADRHRRCTGRAVAGDRVSCPCLRHRCDVPGAGWVSQRAIPDLGRGGGEGVLYYTTIGSLLCVLAFSANTSFVDFPRLCRVVAQDGFLPKSFAIAGRRLVFDVGILYLAVTSGSLLIAFGGITDRLIPLFAIGAFLTFTISQVGMVWHWRRTIAAGHSNSENKAHLAVNTAGALTTGIALIIIVAAKFLEGAWIIILVLPIVIGLLKSIRSYYDQLFDELRVPVPIERSAFSAPVAMVALESWTKLSENALTFAMSISRDVIAIHLLKLSGPDQEEERLKLEERWRAEVEEPLGRAGLPPPRLVILQSQYRNLQVPMMKLIREIRAQYPGKRIAVLIPDVVKDRWYQHLLHTHRAARLRSRLLRLGEELTVINVPLRIKGRGKHGPAG